jgi:VWFA-related protein
MPLFLLLSLFADRIQFHADSRLVLVPVTVTDRRGALVTGLSAEAFSVVQDREPQKITSFGEEDIPASVGIVFDTSGSMRRALPSAKTMLRAFFDRCNPADEALLYTVSSRPGLDSSYTSDFGALLEKTVFTEAKGATALNDTIFAALRQSRAGHNPRKAMVIVSDGMDNHSRYSEAELLSAAMETDLQIYSISIFDPPANRKPIELTEERKGISFLETLSRKTGGLQIVVQNEHETDQAAERIATAIRNQYVLGYSPQNGDDGKWHSIAIRMNLPNTTAWTRPGYWAANR